MPQIILLALVGAAAWYGYKTIKKGINNTNEKLRKSEKKKANKQATELKQDPKTGVYKLDKDN